MRQGGSLLSWGWRVRGRVAQEVGVGSCRWRRYAVGAGPGLWEAAMRVAVLLRHRVTNALTRLVFCGRLAEVSGHVG